MSKKKTKKLNQADDSRRTFYVQVRLSEFELNYGKLRAKKHFGGNLSALIRHYITTPGRPLKTSTSKQENATT